MMRSARLRLPSHMRRPTSRVTLRLLNLGSGTTIRCGTVPRRGIGCVLPGLLAVSILARPEARRYREESQERQTNERPRAPDSAKGAGAIRPSTPLVERLSGTPGLAYRGREEHIGASASSLQTGEHPTPLAR